MKKKKKKEDPASHPLGWKAKGILKKKSPSPPAANNFLLSRPSQAPFFPSFQESGGGREEGGSQPFFLPQKAEEETHVGVRENCMLLLADQTSSPGWKRCRI